MKEKRYPESSFLVRKAFDLAEKGQFAEALEIYNELISKHEVSVLYMQRGITYFALSDFENSIVDLTKAIDLKSDDADYYVNRGNAYLRINDFEAALEDYNKAIELSPKLVKAYNGRSVVYEKMGRIDDACNDLMTAIELDDSYGAPYFNLGLLYITMGKNDEALVCINKANQLRPNDTTILRRRGELHTTLGDVNKAYQDYILAIEADSENLKAHRNLSWLLSTSNQSSIRNGKEALSHAMWCCEKTQWKEASSLEVLAAAYAECGDFDEAVRRQSEALPLRSSKQKETTQQRLKVLQKGLPIRE